MVSLGGTRGTTSETGVRGAVSTVGLSSMSHKIKDYTLIETLKS